jgi:protein O-GlcNAc transferase
MTTLTEPDQLSLEAEVNEANRLLSDGDSEGALALLEPLTSNENAFLPARFLLAMTAWKMGRLDSAVELMRDCHEKWPMDGTVAEVLASLYVQAGNLGESLFMAKLGAALGGPGKLSHLVPKGFPNFDSVFYSFQDKPMLKNARAYLAKGEVSIAMEYVRQHSALNPSDGDSHAFLAALLLRAGMASVAYEVLSSVATKIVGDGEFPAHYASLYARTLAAVGDFDGARRFYAKALALAPESADIAADRIADSVWLDENREQVTTIGEDWTRRFCRTPKPRQWRQPDGKLVIGYIVSAFADPLDMAAVAAVARAHDRKRVTVLGYGTGAQSWNENALLSGAFDKWQDVSALDPATLVRFFVRGGLHVVVDAAGFAAPNCLKALAQVQTAIRVSWLGNSAALGAPIYDAQIVAASFAVRGTTLWRVGSGYPVLAPQQQQLPSRAARNDTNFGADVRMPQLDHETVALWSAVLQAQPGAKLLLRARDMTPGGNIDRLVARFGRELAARIDIVDVQRPEEFYASVDIALLPYRGVSPRMAAEALACGVPPIALTRSGIGNPYASYLQEIGLGSRLVAADEQDFVNIATELATSDASRIQVLGAIASAIGDANARHFAQALEERAIKELASAQGLCS